MVLSKDSGRFPTSDAARLKGLLVFLRSTSLPEASVLFTVSKDFTLYFVVDSNDFFCGSEDVVHGSFRVLNRIKTDKEVRRCDSCSLVPSEGKLINAESNRGIVSFPPFEFRMSMETTELRIESNSIVFFCFNSIIS